MLGIVPDKSLFEILCDTLKLANKKYNVVIPWYIMTSKENNDDTILFFENNNHFGYPKNDIKFFIQGQIPMISKEGKILLNEEGLIKEASDGHGGIFNAMFKNGIVSDMKRRDIKWIFIGPVDNPLVNMADETLIGLAIDKKVLAAGKSLIKANPEEKVGIFCRKNNRPSVIEYTEITDEMAHEVDKNGNLLYGESHMNCNLFNIKAIDKIGDEKLQYHIAFKKADYINEKGELIIGNEPNSYKFETFIFDAFNKLDDMAILRVKREEEFAPVKGATGVDSAETARKLYNQYHNKNI